MKKGLTLILDEWNNRFSNGVENMLIIFFIMAVGILIRDNNTLFESCIFLILFVVLVLDSYLVILLIKLIKYMKNKK